jgi:hypothetical protein
MELRQGIKNVVLSSAMVVGAAFAVEGFAQPAYAATDTVGIENCTVRGGEDDAIFNTQAEDCRPPVTVPEGPLAIELLAIGSLAVVGLAGRSALNRRAARSHDEEMSAI